MHPKWQFNAGFTEEDEVYNPPYEETDAEHDRRTRRALDFIFATDSSACISITAHGGSMYVPLLSHISPSLHCNTSAQY